MNSQKFESWLITNKNYSIKTIQNRISNCRNVERHEGDLDNHFAKDKGISLLERLSYSTENQLNSDIPNHKVPIHGDMREGSATLKYAVKLYMSYKNSAQPDRKKLIEKTEKLILTKKLTESEKTVLTKYRIGQSFFRNQLIDLWNGCCSISGFSKTELLIASHIKPYNKCKENEKYDIYNGLLLTPNYDRLFDRFLISFDKNGKILISSTLLKTDLKKLNIKKNATIKLNENHEPYMKYHRKIFFKKLKKQA